MTYYDLGYKFGEISATEIVPIIIGLYFGYLFWKWIVDKRKNKNEKNNR